METASAEVLDACRNTVVFTTSLYRYFLNQYDKGTVEEETMDYITTITESATESLFDIVTLIESRRPVPQGMAYEYLFTFRERMEPLVTSVQVELDKHGNDGLLLGLFQSIFVF